MLLKSLRGSLALVLALATLTTQTTTAGAETLVGTDIESRMIVGISAEPAAVKAMLPEGWMPIAFPRGPLKGANLLVSFVDGHVMTDADGKPRDPASRRAVTLVSLSKQATGDAVRLFVVGLYTTAPGNDPYGLAQRAAIARETSLTGPADGARDSANFWRAVTESGGQLVLRVNYTTGKRGWSSSEALSYSAANPEFHHIYRYDGITDVVMSAAMEKPVNGTFKLTSTVLELAEIFDGNEKVMAILDVPVRVRKTYLP